MSPENAVFLITIMSAFGLIFLFAAITGREYHTLSPIKIKKRIVAIVAAQIVLGLPVIGVLFLGVSIPDLYNAAIEWRNAEVGMFGMFGWIAYIVNLTALVSPLITLFVVVNLILKKNRGDELNLA